MAAKERIGRLLGVYNKTSFLSAMLMGGGSEGLQSMSRVRRCEHTAALHFDKKGDWNGLGLSETDLLDLRSPASWYPAARQMKRTIIAHMGPTNSGKTYHALNALKLAESGAYCGPLRLLAWEVAEKMNAAQLPFDLITGQERNCIQGSRHVASTVEMADIARPIEVAVVDEIQMMGDPYRGASFTRAILGIPAKEVHVCGDPAALPLIQNLAQEAGDQLEVRTYERLAPLAISNRALRGVDSAQRGDCLVAFSRRDVHALKRQVQSAGKHSCGLVYGALPPSSRAEQAKLFNTARTGYNVLAASDAIGMGLNLNIRRIIFTSMSKFDGTSQRRLTHSEVKQIAGRAGRFGSKYGNGVVTCLQQVDLPYLKSAMKQANVPIPQACIVPRFEQLEMLMGQIPYMTLPEALQAFEEGAVMSKMYFLADLENMQALAKLLQRFPLTTREQYLYACSPTDADDGPVATALMNFARSYCNLGVVPGQICSIPPDVVPSTELHLQHLEALHRVYDLYIWLAFRFEDAYPDRDLIEKWRSQCSSLIRAGLDNLSDKAAGRPWVHTKRQKKVGLTDGEGWKIDAASTLRFPKHLKPGATQRSVVPKHSGGSSGEDSDDDFDPQAPLKKPIRPRETRSERRVRKREEGQRKNIERDFGEGILAPFVSKEPVKSAVPQYGPGPQPKKRKKSAKRKSSPPLSWPIN